MPRTTEETLLLLFTLIAQLFERTLPHFQTFLTEAQALLQQQQAPAPVFQETEDERPPPASVPTEPAPIPVKEETTEPTTGPVNTLPLYLPPRVCEYCRSVPHDRSTNHCIAHLTRSECRARNLSTNPAHRLGLTNPDSCEHCQRYPLDEFTAHCRFHLTQDEALARRLPTNRLRRFPPAPKPQED